MLFIVENSEYQSLEEQPNIEMVESICADLGIPDPRGCAYGGRYVPETNTIMLEEGIFDLDDPYSQAVLTHELVHYFQDINWDGGLHDEVGPETRCKAEEQGYKYQAMYLMTQTELAVDFRRHARQATARACHNAWAIWRQQHPFDQEGIE
jgi:hypothetical protein